MIKSSSNLVPKTVDEYLQALPETVRNTLEKVRKAIKSAAPKAEECISYQIPTYKLNGAIAHFAAFKNHCSYFPASHAVMQTFKEELKDYDTAGATIHFPLDKPLPAALLKKMVIAKLMENEMRVAEKSLKKVAKKKSK